jgi:sec-independent protein translocase protein TatC
MAEEKDEQEEGLQMSFLDHLDELRRRLIHSVIGIAIAFSICFYFSDKIYGILAVPVKVEARKARLDREKRLLEKVPDKLTSLKEGDLAQYTFVFDSAIDQTPIPKGTTVPTRIITKDGRPTAVLAQPLIIGKNVIPMGKEISDVLGEAAAVPGFDSRDDLVITTVGGAFALYMKVGLYAAVAFAIPFLLFQVWAFVSPGLYQHEKNISFLS